MADPIWLDYVAAGGVLASAGVVGWQAWQTRAAVKVSQKAVEASRESVAIAEQALRESQLARLESTVPRIFVTTTPYVHVTKVLRPEEKRVKGYENREVRADEIFKLPRDAALNLQVEHTFRARNDGPGSVLLRLSRGYWQARDINPIIAPGETVEGGFWIHHTVAEWIDILESGTEKEPAESFRMTATYVGPRDADVAEHHTIVVTGSILEPVPDAKGDWRLREDTFDNLGAVSASVLPATRTYWRSRSKKIEF